MNGFALRHNIFTAAGRHTHVVAVQHDKNHLRGIRHKLEQLGQLILQINIARFVFN